MKTHAHAAVHTHAVLVGLAQLENKIFRLLSAHLFTYLAIRKENQKSPAKQNIPFGFFVFARSAEEAHFFVDFESYETAAAVSAV